MFQNFPLFYANRCRLILMADERDSESSATVKNILDDLLRKLIEEEINNFLLQQNNLESTNVKMYKIT